MATERDKNVQMYEESNIHNNCFVQRIKGL